MKKEELFKLIFAKHKTTLKNLNVPQEKKVIILFSGVPGSGKTYLARKIEKRYQAIRWENDIVREIIDKFPKEYFKNISADSLKSFNNLDKETLKKVYGYNKLSIKKENLLQNYKKHIFSNYPFQNKLILFDESIDRSYPLFKNISEKFNFKLYLIKMPFNKKLIRKRVINRGEGIMTFFDANLPRWKDDYNQLTLNTKSDFVFKDNPRELFSRLNKLISKN